MPCGLRRMSLIVAFDLDNGIGKNGTIPWHIRRDFAHFVEKTTNVKDPSKINVVLMGRKCWDSIPQKFKPLRNRFNVVITRTMAPRKEDNLVVTDDYDGILRELATGELSERVETIWNIGGREIYKMALDEDLVDCIVATKINSRFDADVKMPEIDWSKFIEEKESENVELLKEKDLEFSFHVYRRSS